MPPQFEQQSRDELHALIEAHPLGAWVAMAGGALAVNHIPWRLARERGDFGTLTGHVARANDIWRTCSANVESIVVFQGPQAYITPGWYATKREHGKVVPTWNYAVVHAHGVPRVVDDRGWLREHVTGLVDRHEAREAVPWQLSDAPAGFLRDHLDHIVGIEFTIRTLVGKWKVSQNRPERDRAGVVDGLTTRDDDDSQAMARLVAQRGGPDHVVGDGAGPAGAGMTAGAAAHASRQPARGPARAGVLVYVRHLERLAGFYETVFAMRRRHRTDEMIVLQSADGELIVHQMPPAYVTGAPAATPPEPRQHGPYKPYLAVASMAQAAAAVVRLGGRMLDDEWTGAGIVVRNGCDPEGNVFQLRELRP